MKKYLLGIATGYGIGAVVVLAGGPIHRYQKGYPMPDRDQVLAGIQLAAVWPLGFYILLSDSTA